MLRAFLLVGLGGFAGSMARFAVNVVTTKDGAPDFPLSTLLVNLTGCFLIGLLYGFAQRSSWMQQDGWMVLATGFCGGFTTFSTFALEQNAMLTGGRYLSTILYAGLSLIFGLLLCKAGIWLTAARH